MNQYDEPLRIVPRSEWEAVRVEDTVELRTPVNQVLHTYTDTEPCLTPDECKKAIKKMQDTHMNEDDLIDIKYNFIIGGDLNVYEGRGWEFLPHLHPEYPHMWETSIEIAHIGREGVPEESILEVATNLLELGINLNIIKRGFEYNLHFFPGGGLKQDYLSGMSENPKKKEEEPEKEDVRKVEIVDYQKHYAKEFHPSEDEEEQEEWEENLKSSTAKGSSGEEVV